MEALYPLAGTAAQIESNREKTRLKDLNHMDLQGKVEGLFSLEMRGGKEDMIAAFCSNRRL